MAREIKWDQETIRTVLRQEIDNANLIAHQPVLQQAIKAQNEQGLSLQQIQQRDQLWKNSNNALELKQKLARSEASRYLKSLVRQNPRFTEIFVTDRLGASVASYPLTSDYWHGDEEKWQKIATAGWQSYVGAMEYDESTQLNSIQISVPVEENEELIGVLIFGIRLSHVLSKQLNDNTEFHPRR